MKKYVFLIAIAYCLLISWQNSDAQITATTAITYASPNPKVDIGTTLADVQNLPLGQVYYLSSSYLKGGIIGNAFGAGGRIDLKVWYYRDDISNGKGALLYWGYSDVNSTDYVEKVGKTYTESDWEWYGVIPWKVTTTWKSTDFKQMAIQAGIAEGNSYGLNKVMRNVPIIVEVTITNATLSNIKVPGLGEYDALEYFSQQELKKGNLPIGNACNGSNTVECQTLREIRHGDLNQVIVTTHRGFWGYGNVAEVSMSGLQNGYNNKYVSIELDVQQSKDGEVLLLHDQKVNRMISFMATKGQEYPTYDTGNQNDPTIQAAWIQNLNYNTTTPNIPKLGGGTWATFPALKDGRMIDRRGQATTDAVARFDEVLTYIQSGNKPILLSLDIKEKEQTRYMETLSKCLTKAKAAGCLHKIVIKPGSTLELPVETFKNYLSDPSRNQWVDFSYRINLILILVKNTSTSTADGYVPPTKAFIDGWLNVPSMIGVEYIYKYNDATLDVLLKSLPEFDNKSVIAYTKAKGIRTGAFWEIATESRGVPSGTVYAWYSKTSPDKNLTSANGLVNVGVDARNNPEFTIAPPSYNADPTANFPGMINTDRPDLVQAILELNGRYNTKSKRP